MPWERRVDEAWGALTGSDDEQAEARDALLGMIVGTHGRIVELCRAHMSLIDLLAVASRMIGTGRIGGKSVGMLLARSMLEHDDARRRGYENLRLYVMDRDGRNSRVLTGGLDRSVGDPQWAADGRSLYVTVEDEGQTKVARVGLDGVFDGRIFSGQEMPRSKPFPDVYLAAAAALGVDPRRCAVVEDTVTGVQAGVAAGATVFAYSPGTPGHQAPQALLDAGAVIVFSDMATLPDVLRSYQGAAP